MNQPLRLDCQGHPTIDEAYARALEHQVAGRLAEAESLLLGILEVQPRHALALNLRGVVAWLSGQGDRAIGLIREAVAIEPNDPLFHSNLGEMYRQSGHLREAIEYGEKAVALAPDSPMAHGNLGVAYYDAKDYGRAEACHGRALALDPRFFPSLNGLGNIRRAAGDRQGAMDWFHRILESSPDAVEVLSNLGVVLVEERRGEEAAQILERALALRPEFPEALSNLGLARILERRADEAVPLFERVLQLKPRDVGARIGLARAYNKLGKLDLADACLREAILLTPDSAEAYCVLGEVLAGKGATHQADEAYRRALEFDPATSDALVGLADMCLEVGRLEEADQLVHQAIALVPNGVTARYLLTRMKKARAGDDNVAGLEALVRERGREIPPEDLVLGHYGLGKTYDDLGDYERAFGHYQEGARLKFAGLHYDPLLAERRVDEIIRLVDSSYLASRRGAGDPSAQPVFILGMPRSGTTLVEQIVASHPEVHGGGELTWLHDILDRTLPKSAADPVPCELARVSRETLTAWGQDYASRLNALAPEARRITDKLPGNYKYLGLIPLMLPQARIIHVRRNALDTCLSCFAQLFSRDNLPWSYDLAETGRQYVRYARLMDHWGAVMPPGSFLEVNYEDLVADLEGQARRMIAFCGLDWDDACLAFHQTQRQVRTASVAQVRQPLYGGSVQRWRHYEKFLGPLLSVLGPFAPLDHLAQA